ncbi:DUF4365 domain-containing protein [Microvirga sp. GCM10011540]|uniref:DUF4365 domain-containing protein n=1 Tax=Microvirga sp. GCM10011540 TaxID=3317338 RepID=UPI00360BFE58
MKKLHLNQITGERGVHIFSNRILAAGLSFHTPSGALDTGVDGFIELRDPHTGEVRAQYIAAQLKTMRTLPEDNGEIFAYRATERDIEYWFNANTPVILVVVHLDSELVWWKSIQGYFADPERKRSRKVVFHRKDDELRDDTVASFAELVAGFARPGIVTPSLRTEEELETNLLRVDHPFRVNLAVTDLDAKEVRQALLRRHEYPPMDWIVHGGRLITFRDLDDPLFEDACDLGSIDQIDTRDWFEADGDVTKRQFVYLLQRCLTERIRDRLRYSRAGKYHFFKPDRRNGIERTIRYQSFARQAKRKVVSAHGKAQSGSGPSYYRHAAFVPRFLEIQDEWYLAIEPTYHFTRDGVEEYAYASERLATIKRFETNANVRGHIGMWRAVLTDGGDLFRDDYPYLTLDAVPSLRHSFGVPDGLWTEREDPEERKTREEGQRELLL